MDLVNHVLINVTIVLPKLPIVNLVPKILAESMPHLVLVQSDIMMMVQMPSV